MLHNEGKSRLAKRNKANEEATLEELCNPKNKKWARYIKNLRSFGHFQGYMEHSAPWKERMALARKAFAEAQRSQKRQSSGPRADRQVQEDEEEPTSVRWARTIDHALAVR